MTDEPDPGRGGLAAGRVLGGIVTALGLLLLVHAPLAAWRPGSFAPPLVPYFGRLRVWNDPWVLGTEIAAGLAGIVVGLLLWRRHRLAPTAFLVAGWGGAALTIAAFWPGDRVRLAMRMAVRQAERAGAPPGTTFYDLIPDGVLLVLEVVTSLLVLLLVVGTIHVVVARRVYRS